MAEGFDPARLARRDLRRLVSELWDDPRCDAVAPAVLDAAIGADARSLDRTVLSAYLRAFPTDHPAFERLRAASALGATRRDWPWRARGERWALWDRDAGPARLAAALLAEDDAAAVLREAGLDGELAQGKLIARTLETACGQAANKTGDAAVATGERLIALHQHSQFGGSDAVLTWGLLHPWEDGKPRKAYERRLTNFLSDRIGDPRIAQARWLAIEDELMKRNIRLKVSPSAILRRWLTEATVRAFFTIVRSTTDRKDQWDAREAFWLGYLDVEAIGEAWFAFGRRAEAQAGRLAQEEEVRFGRVYGGADPSHSALLMTIGDMRVAEWSHDGAFRVWPNYRDVVETPTTRWMAVPKLYEEVYDGTRLRTMVGPKGFEHLSHVSGWQRKFAAVIHRHSGIAHPTWGSGR